MLQNASCIRARVARGAKQMFDVQMIAKHLCGIFVYVQCARRDATKRVTCVICGMQRCKWNKLLIPQNQPRPP